MSSQSAQKPPEWVWDEPRQCYRYWSSAHGAWIWHDAEAASKGQNPEAKPAGESSQHPHSPNAQHEHASAIPSASNVQYNPALVPRYAPTTDAEQLTSQLGQVVIGQNPKSLGTPGDDEDDDDDDDPQTAPTTEGSPGFELRDPKSFFKVGKIIKFVYPQNYRPSNHAADKRVSRGSTIISTSGQQFYLKDQWLAIIKDCWFFYVGLPINTYGGRGVAKRETRKSDHAIIHSSPLPPAPEPDEMPAHRKQRALRKPAIRVVPNNPQEQMDPMSRINFNKPMSIEKNVKVYDYGMVHPDSMAFFKNHFQDIWGPVQNLPADDAPSLPQTAAANYAYTQVPTYGTSSVASTHQSQASQAHPSSRAAGKAPATASSSVAGYSSYNTASYGSPQGTNTSATTGQAYGTVAPQYAASWSGQETHAATRTIPPRANNESSDDEASDDEQPPTFNQVPSNNTASPATQPATLPAQQYATSTGAFPSSTPSAHSSALPNTYGLASPSPHGTASQEGTAPHFRYPSQQAYGSGNQQGTTTQPGYYGQPGSSAGTQSAGSQSGYYGQQGPDAAAQQGASSHLGYYGQQGTGAAIQQQVPTVPSGYYNPQGAGAVASHQGTVSQPEHYGQTVYNTTAHQQYNPASQSTTSHPGYYPAGSSATAPESHAASPRGQSSQNPRKKSRDPRKR